MQQRIAQGITKSDRKEVDFGIEAEFEHLNLEPTKNIYQSSANYHP